MAITAQELVIRALTLLSAGDDGSPWMAMEMEAELAIGQAMQELGIDVANDPKSFGLLQQGYSVTLSSTTGAGSLVSAVGASTTTADMIWGSVPRGYVYDTATDTRLVYIPDRANFEGYVDPGFLYYTIYAGNIYTRTSNGSYPTDKTGVQGALTVTANFYPAIQNPATTASLPAELESNAVRQLARVMAEKYKPALDAK